MDDYVKQIDNTINEIIKGFIIAVAILGAIAAYVIINYTPTVTDTEYFADNNCSVTKVYSLKGVNYVNV